MICQIWYNNDIMDKTIDIKNIKAIDIHSHYNTKSIYDTQTSEIYRADIDFLHNSMVTANIEKIFCSTFSSVISSQDIVKENDYNYLMAAKYHWLYQWVVIDPDNQDTFKQAEEMLKNKKCIGIKIHPVYHNYSIKEKGEKIFSFAQKNNAVVLMHPPYYDSHNEMYDLVPLANNFGNVKMIVAHLGSLEHVDIMQKAKYNNIFTDTSGIASSKNYIIEYAVKQIGSERILFGTDTYAAGFLRGRIEYAMISDNDKKNILCDNTKKLFNL